MKSPATIAAILRSYVGDRRLVDCAEQLDMGVSTLSRLLRGINVPHSRQLKRMAPILGIACDKLIKLADRDRQQLDRRRSTAATIGRKPRAKSVLA